MSVAKTKRKPPQPRAVNWRGDSWHRSDELRRTRCGLAFPSTFLKTGTISPNLRVVNCKNCKRVESSAITGAAPQRAGGMRLLLKRAPTTSSVARAVAGGRATVDSQDDPFTNALSHIPGFQIAHQDYWQGLDVDTTLLEKMPPAKLLELMVDISPELSRGMWDFLIMFNPGWEVHAYKLGAEEQDDKSIDTRGEKALTEIVDTLQRIHGAADVVFNSLGIQLFLRGSLFAELVLGRDVRTFVDLATPDPTTLYFKRVMDEERGACWSFGQYQAGTFIRLDDVPTVRYLPIHPLPGKIQGRSPANSSLFVCLFLLVMLHDLRRVLQRQGYPRIDISLDLEKLKELMPEDDQLDYDTFEAWSNALVAEVKSVYSKLAVDEAYIHSDVVEVNKQPVGTMNASGLGIIDALFKAIERMATRALKTMPLLMATTDGVSEANANRQWEIHAQSIKSMQHYVEQLLSYLLTLALQAQGIVTNVVFRFAELRAAELMRDAQVDLLRATLAALRYDRGWISQDEAAQQGADKKQADQKEPRVKQASGVNPLTGADAENPEPGSNRSALDFLMRYTQNFALTHLRTPTTLELENALKFWNTNAPTAAKDLPLAETQE